MRRACISLVHANFSGLEQQTRPALANFADLSPHSRWQKQLKARILISSPKPLMVQAHPPCLHAIEEGYAEGHASMIVVGE